MDGVKYHDKLFLACVELYDKGFDVIELAQVVQQLHKPYLRLFRMLLLRSQLDVHQSLV